MSISRPPSPVSVVAWTLPWAVLGALADAFLLERWYGVSARKPLHYPELALNALWAACIVTDSHHNLCQKAVCFLRRSLFSDYLLVFIFYLKFYHFFHE